jgi:hypothetical protein
MAGFHNETFKKYDDYMTPQSTWNDIKKYIPKDKVIWEAFYGDGKSGQYLKALGCKEVIHDDMDFFKNNPEYDMIITNPPFTLKKEVFTRLKELGKPFIVICPCSMINTQYFRRLFSQDENPIQIILPKKRIQFIKIENGEPVKSKTQANFDCFYYTWKMNLPRDIIWLND